MWCTSLKPPLIILHFISEQSDFIVIFQEVLFKRFWKLLKGFLGTLVIVHLFSVKALLATHKGVTLGLSLGVYILWLFIYWIIYFFEAIQDILGLKYHVEIPFYCDLLKFPVFIVFTLHLFSWQFKS